MSPLAHAPLGPPPMPITNQLLAALEARDLAMLEPIDYVRLAARSLVFEVNEPLRYVYFPARGIVSFVQAKEGGAMAEIAHVGAEGMVGVTALLGAERARQRVIGQVPGYAYRVTVRSARAAFADSATFRSLALKATERLLLQLSQNVFCKLAHSVEQQFCSRLLFYVDSAGTPSLEMTHEQMADALGARRQSITEVARRLQLRQVITYSRGRISVLDACALQRHACECYPALREAYRASSAQSVQGALEAT